jgi:hypothetical protein
MYFSLEEGQLYQKLSITTIPHLYKKYKEKIVSSVFQKNGAVKKSIVVIQVISRFNHKQY